MPDAEPVSDRGRFRSRSRRDVVLSVRFYSNNDNIEPYLKPGGRVGDFPADIFIQEARRVIESELPRELDEVFGLRVQTRVIAVREGSIWIFVGAVIGGLATFSRYKNLVESVDLLRRQMERLLGSMIERRFPDDINMDVTVEYPRLERPGDWPWRWRKLMRDPEDEMMAAHMLGGNGVSVNRRDGFFWFLLLLCLLETSGLVLLVWQAVSRTYFHSP